LSTLMVAFLAGADRAIIPEVPYDPEKLAYLVQRDKTVNPNNYAVVLVSDGSRIIPDKLLKYTPHLSPRSKSEVLRLMTEEKAREARAEEEFTLDEVVETGSSLAGSGMVVAELLGHLLDEEVFLQPLTYLLRTGAPDGQDLLGATNFAIMAARLLRDGNFGRMTAYQQRYNLTHVDLNMVTQGVHGVNVEEMYDVNNYRPKINLIWAAQE
jgi:ATP-dependent phosphofructokinase / diphosphate-dependent phosphofructokinase